MHDALYDLKDMLCKQLEDYGKKGEMSAAILERVDILAHAAKNLDKIIESKEMEENGEYSGRAYDGMSYRYDGRSYRDGGHSMARGRGSNARRDSMGRYAGDGYDRDGYSRGSDTMSQLHAAMEDAADERTRQEIQRTISRLENR